MELNMCPPRSLALVQTHNRDCSSAHCWYKYIPVFLSVHVSDVRSLECHIVKMLYLTYVMWYTFTSIITQSLQLWHALHVYTYSCFHWWRRNTWTNWPISVWKSIGQLVTHRNQTLLKGRITEAVAFNERVSTVFNMNTSQQVNVSAVQRFLDFRLSILEWTFQSVLFSVNTWI